MSSPSPPPTSESSSDTEGGLSDSSHERAAILRATSFSQSRRIFPMAKSSPHPFAASSKGGIRDPPARSRGGRPRTPPSTPPVAALKRASSATVGGISHRHSPPRAVPSPLPQDDVAQKLWDTAVSSAIDGAQGKVDLSGHNLAYIPPSIIDLKSLVVLPQTSSRVQELSSAATSSRAFKRSATAPAIVSRADGPRPFLPTSTTSALKLSRGTQKKNSSTSEIELYLMRNAIRALPRELFELDTLVVLSLRQNKLTSIPPAIQNLTRLRELNIASNRLRYLPAEILKLHLTSLHLHPNPFITAPCRSTEARRTRILGPLQKESSVPTLCEIMLRWLLAPATPIGRSPTWLEAFLPFSLDDLPLPSHIQSIIFASTRKGVTSGHGTDAEKDVTANVCPNPDHAAGHGMLFSREKSDKVFSVPVEARMEWVSVVAGVQVAESAQASVPVLWRGCSKGCLTFLEEQMEVDPADDDEPGFVAGSGDEGEPFEFSDEE